MDLLKKILVIISGIVLIAAVIYIINISQQAQQGRSGKKVPFGEETPFTDTTAVQPYSDSLMAGKAESDTAKISPLIPDSVEWRRMPKEKQPVIKGAIPEGNPNPLFIAASKRILPAVVSVNSQMLISSNMPDDEFHHLFRDQDDKEDYYGEGTGSGIIIGKEGYIITNFHVVEKATEFSVVLYDKREFQGKYVGGDPNTDIAVIKIEGDNFPVAYIGNSDSVQIGEWVMAVGNPLNFTSTVTAGIISALGRDIRIIDERYAIENFIQTDAVINPGNSGGALINMSGEVIGINTAIATRTGLYQGYGFAIPINLAIKIVNDILKFGEVKRGLLGVTIGPVDSKAAKGLGLPRPIGVLIQGLEEGYPAAKSGLEPGDVILSVNGDEVTSINDLQIKIARKNPGEVVNLKVWRNQHELNFKVKLGKAPVNTRRSLNNNHKKTYENLGLVIRNLSGTEKNKYEVESGIYIQGVKSGSPADKSQVRPEQVLIAVNDKPINSDSEFEQIVANTKSGGVLKLSLRRRTGQSEFYDHLAFVEKE